MEEEKEEYKGERIEEWNEEENEKDQQRIEEDRKYLEELEDENQDISDLRDPYDELWRSPLDKDPWEGGGVMNRPIPLRQYLFSFSFSFSFNYWMHGNLLPTWEWWLNREMQEKDNVYK